jgi:hypothetical protein
MSSGKQNKRGYSDHKPMRAASFLTEQHDFIKKQSSEDWGDAHL